MSAPPPILELDSVVKRHPQADGSQLTVLDGVNLRMAAGETVSVAGRSGSGKSSLLHLAAGLETPTSGRVCLGGKDLGTMGDGERSRFRGRTMGFIFQFFHLVPWLSVRENVLLPARITGTARVGDEDADLRGDRLIAAVDLGDRAREPARILSGGEMQRTAIARALLLRPPLLLADEPTGNLDAEAAVRVTDLLFRLARENESALLLVTHDPDLADRAGIRLRLEGGRLGSLP